jgi:hypothetical protein
MLSVEQIANNGHAQWYHDLRDPLKRHYVMQLERYQKEYPGQFVVLWNDKGAIQELFFPTSLIMYTEMVKPENRQWCGPQSMEFYIPRPAQITCSEAA